MPEERCKQKAEEFRGRQNHVWLTIKKEEAKKWQVQEELGYF